MSGRSDPALNEPTAPATFRDVLLRTLRRLERLAHPIRRRRALAAVERAAPVREVVFVCLANVCRSAYAEAALKERLPPTARVRVRSVGFLSPGRPSTRTAVQVAQARGIDLTGHRSSTISAPDLRSADLVLAMTSELQRRLRWHLGQAEALHLGDLDPGPVEFRDIEDPVERDAEFFEGVFDRIDRAVAVLAPLIAKPVPGLDEEGNDA